VLGSVSNNREKTMNSNEVVHFIRKDMHGKHSYPRQTIDMSNDRVNWLPNHDTLQLETIKIPEGTKFGDVILDLQAGSSCFLACYLSHDGNEFIHLIGNGWAERGFPFYDDAFNPADPYEMGSGCYAFLKGEAKRRFLKIAATDCLPDFSDCHKATDNFTDNFILSAD
jgi:GR25 family glycosyltransferase involved in LPS biosynthesis